MVQNKEKNRTEQLKAIRAELLAAKDSPLYHYRQTNHYYPVIGEGDHEATIMFVGEAPGKNEALTAKPFCGSAGRILDELLASINIDRRTVYVTNIVKDRPPDNRDPAPEEIAYYAPYLDRQIAIIQPKVIATLGRFAARYLLEHFNSPAWSETIGQLHGRPIAITADFGPLTILPLFHPAAAIYNQKLKATLLADFYQLAEYK
ncbi:MAG: uracil-DNA glycosylase [Candidatus Paceibacterota bacterium]